MSTDALHVGVALVTPRSVHLSSSLLILGTSSGAGKSTIVTGLCRWLQRQGVSVAPFKAQNMSLNSFVTSENAEMGRAQVVQAQAARVTPEVAMNPVLLKPGSDTSSQVIVMGHAVGDLDAKRHWHRKQELLDVVLAAHADLRRRFDVVLCEGAGSPAEINLRNSDIVNLGFARAANVPALLVGDIDRGGVFASLVGTLALLEPEDQDLIRGFIINRFRGAAELLDPALAQLTATTGRRVLGVTPFVRGLELDAEDATDFSSWLESRAPLGEEVLRVGVVALPRTSNLTDVDPLVNEPGVVVRGLYRPEQMLDCDLVIVPGTRATLRDLAWLRDRGFDEALAARARADQPILGVCGGYQMLGERVEDFVESRDGVVEGLGLLPVRTVFQADKILAQRRALLANGTFVSGYQIHHGAVSRHGGEELFAGEGCARGAVAGTTWHGLFENDEWRRAYLREVARRAGRRFVVAPDVRFADRREERIEILADLIDHHLDGAEIFRLLEGSSEPLARVTLQTERS